MSQMRRTTVCLLLSLAPTRRFRAIQSIAEHRAADGDRDRAEGRDATSRRCRPASPRSPPRRSPIPGSATITEAAIFAPNTVFTEFTARKVSNARFRGIGSSPANPAITTYLDGVPQLNSNSSNIELLDVNQIEFVRGPQSPLFGRNTLGGIVNVTSTRPSMSRWTGSVIAPFGNSGAMEVRGNVSGPLGDKAAISFAGGKQQRDGYTENSVTGNDLDYARRHVREGAAAVPADRELGSAADLRARARSRRRLCARRPERHPHGAVPRRRATTRASPTATSTTPPSTCAASARTSRSRAPPASSRGTPRMKPISTIRRCRSRSARTWKRARSSRSRSASRRRTTRRSRSARRWSSGRRASSTSTRATTRMR